MWLGVASKKCPQKTCLKEIKLRAQNVTTIPSSTMNTIGGT